MSLWLLHIISRWTNLLIHGVYAAVITQIGGCREEEVNGADDDDRLS